MKRNIREIFVNNYNAEWLNVWNANMDIQVCLDYFGVITYITDYYTKDESGTMPFLINALKECAGKQHSEMLRVIANTFLTHRLKGECEALYCIDPNLHLTDSNMKTVWVDCNIPCNRRKFLRKIADDSDSDEPRCDNANSENEENVHEQDNNSGIIRIPGKKGQYVQNSSSIHEKYALRPTSLSKLCLAQFSTSYDTCPVTAKCVKIFKKGDNVKQSSQVIVTGEQHNSFVEYLPEVVNIDGRFMKLRNQRSVLRHKKYREDTESHPFMYSELLLFHPWREERELSPDDFESCLALYESKCASIEKVKNILFPHQNNIEQGRALIELLGDARTSHIGDELDPEHEQLQENDGKVATEMDAKTLLGILMIL